MKSLASKLLAFVFIIALATGCASSVTDPGLDQQPDTEQITNQQQPDDIKFGDGAGMHPIVDKPE